VEEKYMFEPIEVKLDGGYDIELPRLFNIRQKFKATKLKSISEAIELEFRRLEIKKLIKPGHKIAVAVGSRGISNLKEIVIETILNLKKAGTTPFIIPAMGSHGGATEEGQAQVLASLGITEESVGVPIVSSMDTVKVATTITNIPIHFDKVAYQADGIVIINRVKPHTSFRGPIESGLTKMLAIGLGNHKGASYIHSLGFEQFSKVIPEVGKLVLEKTSVLFGVAILENAYDETARIELVSASRIMEREPELLQEAKTYMPRLIPQNFDVLVIEQIGKEISGAGMDPNIVGRRGVTSSGFDAPNFQKTVVLDLTDKTNGNAMGIGLADVTTRNLVSKINFCSVYANAITSTSLTAAKIPVVMNTEKEAIVVALRTCNGINLSQAKIVLIKNTLELDRILVSEPVLEDIKTRGDIEVLAEDKDFAFDDQGKLLVRPSDFCK